MKDAVTLLFVAWNRVSTETFAICWKNILSLAGGEDNIPLSIPKVKWDAEINVNGSPSGIKSLGKQFTINFA